MTAWDWICLVTAGLVFVGLPLLLIAQFEIPTCEHEVDIGYRCRWCEREMDEEFDL